MVVLVGIVVVVAGGEGEVDELVCASSIPASVVKAPWPAEPSCWNVAVDMSESTEMDTGPRIGAAVWLLRDREGGGITHPSAIPVFMCR